MSARITVMELLTWTYRDELVKHGGLGYAEPGALLEAVGLAGVAAFTMRGPVTLGAPHPDAWTVHRAVQAIGPIAALAGDGAEARAGLLQILRVCLGPMAAAAKHAADWLERAERIARRAEPAGPLLTSVALKLVKPPQAECWACEPQRNANGYVIVEGVRMARESIRVQGRRMQRSTMLAGWCPLRWTPERWRCWTSGCAGASPTRP